MMDLVTLVTLCSLGVDPKLMHALVWHQSGGEPWSFALPREREPRVYRKLRDAVREANALHTDRPIRVGLAGLVTNASAVTETTFLPCPNIAAAAHQINQLTARCEALPRSDTDPTLAPSPLITGLGNAPTRPSPGLFVQPLRITTHRISTCLKKPGSKVRNALLDMPPAAQTRLLSASEHPSEDNERAWSSALFPTKQERSEDTSDATSNDDSAAKKPQSRRQQDVQRSVTSLPTNGLFVPRSLAGEP